MTTSAITTPAMTAGAMILPAGAVVAPPCAPAPSLWPAAAIALALYVHIPWCVRKCPYCDFNSHTLHGAIPEADYLKALLADLDHDLQYARNRPVRSIFIGGGTPSLLSERTVAELLEGIARRVALAPNAEITLEANPGTVEQGRFKGFAQAGVNRLSVGVQSFDDACLKRLGRIHDGRAAQQAVKTALHGFPKVNIDLMYALPGQTVAGCKQDLTTVLALGPAHLSFYQLTLEPDTPFYRRPPLLPDEDTGFSMQNLGQALLVEHGYDQYEVSAYARPDSQCAHNLNYWQFGDYLGIGAGAHGKLTQADGVMRTWKHRQPRRYLKTAVEGNALEGIRTLTQDELMFEFLLNALRLTEGFEPALFAARTGLSLVALDTHLTPLIRQGLICRENGRIKATPHGWTFLNDLLIHLLPS